MGAIEGFNSTWESTRETFGVGTPHNGEKFDKSSALDGLASNMAAAAPGSRWTGAGATSYDTANTEHRQIIGQLAGLDKQLGAEVDKSAQVVTAGRQKLESIRQWVAAAVASVPPGKTAEQMKAAIAKKGLAQIQEVIEKSNAESNAIGGRIRALDAEYQKLGIQRFSQKEGEGPLGDTGGDKKGDDPAKSAKEDVEKTLKDGDQQAAGRVESVLGSIKPYQELSTEQAAYLNEMQSQQSGMSVKDLKSAEDRLGDKGHVIGDSWQLMSNDDVPKSAGKFDEQQKGGFDRLPQSVQDALKSPGVLGDQQMQDIAAVVKDGNVNLQNGTELDREMIRKADRMMDAPLFADSTGQPADGSTPQYDAVVQDIFESAGRDHQIVHDQLTGTHGDDGQDFMHDITHHEWNDDGKAAGSLFEWTQNSTGPEGQIAAETANVYADYLGTYSEKLLEIDGNRQIGDMNPEMVKAFSNGLMPYQEEMVTDQPAVNTAFHRLDDLGSTLDKTKGLFAVIDSQPDAAREWNKSAYQNALGMQQSFADYAKEHPDLSNGDKRLDDLQSSARLLGVIDGGMSQETLSNIKNGQMDAAQALANATEAYEFKRDIIQNVFSYGPGGDLVTNGLADKFADTFAGGPPDASDFKFNEDGTLSDVGLTANETSVQHQITQAQYTVASQFVHPGDAQIDARFFDGNGQLKPPSQIDDADWSLYDSQLTASMAGHTQISAMMAKFGTTFSHIGGYKG